jgi:Tol biopolymer transport system component
MPAVSQSIQTIALSPNRKRLAYFTGPSDDLTLYLLSLDVPEPQMLDSGLRCSDPFIQLVWSADSRTIYFAADDGNWFHDLWCADAATHTVEQLTNFFHTNTYPIAISPDGDTLLTISNLRGEFNLRTFDVGSRQIRKITDYASPVKSAVYSPAGTQIAYTANGTANPHNSDIFLMNADGFSKQKLLSTLAGALDVVKGWASTGRYLAVESNYEGGWRAGVYDLRTLDLAWFTPAGETARALGFSPDGERFLFERDGSVTVVEVASGEQTTLPNDMPAPPRHAVWLDGDRILMTTQTELFTFSLKDGAYQRLVS